MNLVLFFTRGVSLQTWDQVGMFDREVAIYRRLMDQGVNVTFITYGTAKDLDYADRIPGIKIRCNRWSIPSWLYEQLLPWLHASPLKHADLFKTNQTNGADIALWAAQIWKKPLIARCGYIWSLNTSRQFGENSTNVQTARNIETTVFRSADRVVVTTPMMAIDITQRIPEAAKRIRVIPNYVETERFTPLENSQISYDVVFVGRLSMEKNLGALLEAVQSLSVRTAIIGEGELRDGFERQYASSTDRISFLGNVPNRELPLYLNKAYIFVLPSLYEGHPKTLLEAMACGMPVIGANSPGIREVITHGENGWLCETDAESIKNAISYLLANPQLCKKLGENARKYALDTFSLDRIIEMEMDVYRSVLGELNAAN
jgi:glycosyltransferase involved in cell wall biosynthesis